MEENRDITETEKNDGEKKTPKKNSPYTLGLLAAALVVMVFMGINYAKNSGKEEACVIVPQSPFGQSQKQIWIEFKDDLEAKGIAEFGLEYPDAPEGYDIKTFKVYTRQINSVYYTNDSGEEGMRVIKAKMCGKDVFESGFYNDSNEYTFTKTVKDGDRKILLKGNDSGVQVASWVDDDFSYAIGVWHNPVSEETMLKYVSEVK